MRIRTSLGAFVLAVIALLAPARAMAQATTDSWSSAVSGGWEDASKWGLGSVPLAGTNVLIGAVGSSYAVTYSNPVSYAIGGLAINNSAGNTTTLYINTNSFTFKGGTWSNAAVIVNAGGVVTNSAAFTMANSQLTINGGRVTFTSGTVQPAGPINVYDGLLEVTGGGTFSTRLNQTGGVVRILYGAGNGMSIADGSVISGGVFSNLVMRVGPSGTGTVTLTNQGQIVGWGFYINAGGMMRVDGGSMLITSNFFDVGTRDDGTISSPSSNTFLQTAGVVSMADAAGLVIGATNASARVSTTDRYILSGGTLNLQKITVGPASSLATNRNQLFVGGGVLNLGAGGIVMNQGAPAQTNQVLLSGGTLGAQAAWSSSANMILTNNVGPGVVTFRASDTNDVAQDITLTGALTGPGGLVKAGGGTLSLNGANSYGGNTEVSNGTLRVNGVSSGTGLLSVYSNATLGGTGSLRSVTLFDGGRLAPGNSIGTLTVSNLTLNPGSLFDFELAATNASDQVVDLGTLTLAQLQFSNFSFTTNAGFGVGSYTLVDASLHSGDFGTITNESFYGYLGTISLGGFDGNDLVLNVVLAVPEPASLLALGGGLGLLALLRAHRREA